MTKERVHAIVISLEDTQYSAIVEACFETDDNCELVRTIEDVAEMFDLPIEVITEIYESEMYEDF